MFENPSANLFLNMLLIMGSFHELKCNVQEILVSDHISQSSVEKFYSNAQHIVQSLSDGWLSTAVTPQLVVSFLISSDTFPSKTAFESFVSNKFLNPNKIIKWTTWNQHIENAERAAFEQDIRKYQPEFQIFLYGVDGSVYSMPENSSVAYDPIIYCSPSAESLIGFDVLNDAIEGPTIRYVRSTGRVTSAPPFPLRGLPTDVVFKMGMTMYIPLYRNNSNLPGPGIKSRLTTQLSAQYAGCIASVFHFAQLLQSILEPLDLLDTDVTCRCNPAKSMGKIPGSP
jgi:hypothetical protein